MSSFLLPDNINSERCMTNNDREHDVPKVNCLLNGVSMHGLVIVEIKWRHWVEGAGLGREDWRR